MTEITKQQADIIIHEHLHTKAYKRSVACFRGQWFDVRGMSKQEILSAVIKRFGFAVNPDAMI